MNRYEALTHAIKAHAGQVDKCGQPYILHPIAVAEAIERTPLPSETTELWPDSYLVAALLHDVLEDTAYELVVTPPERYRLEKLTRRPGEKYADYIDRLCDSWGADGREVVPLVVKLADLWHNLSPQRQDCLPRGERKGLEKRYLKARDQIWSVLGWAWWPQEAGDARD